MKKKYCILFTICIAIYFIVNSVIFYNNLLLKDNISSISKMFYYISSLALLIITSIILIKVYKSKNLKPEIFFLTVAIIFGIIYLFATPLFKGHDEQYHWYKSYAVSLGEFMPKYNIDKDQLCDNLPVSIARLYSVQGSFTNITYKTELKSYIYAEVSKCIMNPNKIIPMYNAPTAFYPFVQMLPQAVGIIIAKLLRFSVFFQALFARIGNLLLYITLGYFSIKLLPIRKYFLTAFLLCPKVMYISATMSGDVFTNSITILFISYVLNIIDKKEILSKKQILILAILTPLVAISKIVYLPVCGLLFLLPKECFKNKKEKNITVFCLILLALCTSFIWLKISTSFLSTSDPNTTRQISYIIHNPVKYTATLIRQSIKHFGEWSLDIVGGYMEWGSKLIQNPVISICVYIVLVMSLMKKEKTFEINKCQKIFVFLILLIVIALIETALYVQWTPQYDGIGGSNILGVQGRYFTPIMLLIPLLIPISWLNKKNININEKVIYFSVILWQVPTILNILVRNI